jgi:hypothetical protein
MPACVICGGVDFFYLKFVPASDDALGFDLDPMSQSKSYEPTDAAIVDIIIILDATTTPTHRTFHDKVVNLASTCLFFLL